MPIPLALARPPGIHPPHNFGPPILSPQPLRAPVRPSVVEAAALAASQKADQQAALAHLCAEATAIARRGPPQLREVSDASFMVHAGNPTMALGARNEAGVRPDATPRLTAMDHLFACAQAAGVELPAQVWTELIDAALGDLKAVAAGVTLVPTLSAEVPEKVRRNWFYVPTSPVFAGCYQTWLDGLARFFAPRRPLFAALAAAHTRHMSNAYSDAGNAEMAQFFLTLHFSWHRQAAFERAPERRRARSVPEPALPTIFEEAQATPKRAMSDNAQHAPAALRPRLGRGLSALSKR